MNRGVAALRGPGGPGPPIIWQTPKNNYICRSLERGKKEKRSPGPPKKEKRSPGPPNNFNPATPLMNDFGSIENKRIDDERILQRKSPLKGGSYE